MTPFKPTIHRVTTPSGLSRGVRRSTHGELRWSQYDEKGVLRESGIEQEQDSETKIWKTHAFKSGDLGFMVGDWFVCPRAAHDCGIIDFAKNDARRSITHDSEMAYAVLIRENEEVDLHNPMIDPSTNETIRQPVNCGGLPRIGARASAALADDPTIVRYKAHPRDPGRFKLMRNMNMSYPVRVLRSWDSLGSGNWLPRGGVRYEGLYRVSAQGTKLIPSSESHDGRDHWHYTFDLKREPEQPPFSNALLRPTEREMEVWERYMQESEDYDEGVRQYSYGVGLESGASTVSAVEGTESPGSERERNAEIVQVYEKEVGMEVVRETTLKGVNRAKNEEEETLVEKMSAWRFGGGYLESGRGRGRLRQRGLIDGSSDEMVDDGEEEDNEDEELGPLGEAR
ncbi:MAG: hypothetical protein MMC33_005815 [Icmadophila ericetorum]|nr:hypothetical protein [Icmadophila ericetorum]